jgi:hypothetical protein
MTDANAADDAQSPAKEDRALNAFALALQSSQLNPFLNVLGEAALACAAICLILTYCSLMVAGQIRNVYLAVLAVLCVLV